MDAVVTDRSANRTRVAAIAEAKWGDRPMGPDSLGRLRRLAALVPLSDSETRLVLANRGGFGVALKREAQRDSRVVLVDLDRLYHGA